MKIGQTWCVDGPDPWQDGPRPDDEGSVRGILHLPNIIITAATAVKTMAADFRSKTK